MFVRFVQAACTSALKLVETSWATPAVIFSRASSNVDLSIFAITADIATRDPEGMPKTAFAIWSRHVRQHPPTNPHAVQEHVEKHGGTFLERASALLGQPIIKDIAFSCCTIDDPALDNKFVANVLVARVFPNDLHIADLNLVNPNKPIPPKRQKYRFRKYKGLGLAGTVLTGAEAFAASQKCDDVTLTAADDDLVPLFTRFVLEDEDVASLTMEKKVGE